MTDSDTAELVHAMSAPGEDELPQVVSPPLTAL